ncbi:protease complex subunit PrcB family protein [Flavobacterium sp. N2270]|uniref:protease complex subunit PrcB family protein n=1 Tax=Flavobacterium sp. N2270 TaxID=2986831 RepID=UPI0022242DA4|nr:protease complex subunit PrcB family protein [Flavobacterium sp. N2270]
MKHIFIILSITLLSCSSGKDKSNVKYKVLHSGQNASIENKEFILIENNDDYIAAIEKLNVDESDYENLLNVDFKSNNVCILFLGERSNGGYSIEVDYIKKKENALYIKTKEITPQKHSNVIMVITHPYCLISLPKNKNIVIK